MPYLNRIHLSQEVDNNALLAVNDTGKYLNKAHI
jgi:hypothetical protein